MNWPPSISSNVHPTLWEKRVTTHFILYFIIWSWEFCQKCYSSILLHFLDLWFITLYPVLEKVQASKLFPIRFISVLSTSLTHYIQKSFALLKYSFCSLSLVKYVLFDYKLFSIRLILQGGCTDRGKRKDHHP